MIQQEIYNKLELVGEFLRQVAEGESKDKYPDEVVQ